VRRFFVLSHKHRYVIGLPAAAALLVVLAAVAVAPRPPAVATRGGAQAVSFARIRPILERRCVTCHAAKPTRPGFTAPPAGVLLDTPQHARANARRAYEQAVATHAMPLGNITHMTDAERALLGAWVDTGAKI
jgi:uncharacterized membrane protein